MRQRPVDNPFRESVRVLGLFVRGEAIIIGILMMLYAVGFAAAHVPLWPLVAILAGLCYAVPYFGSLIALATAGAMSALFDGNLAHLLTVLGVWVVIQAIEGFWLTPHILGRPLGLRPLIVFFALIAASFLFGPIGFLLTVPALAVGNVFWRYFRERR